MDAGATKTQVYVGDENGHVLGEGKSGPGNYQICGEEAAEKSYTEAVKSALEAASLTLNDIDYAVLGLSGADDQVDLDILVPMCKKIMGDVPHDVIHDSWLGLRNGAKFGVVSICGTGAGHAGKNQEGDQVQLRNLSFQMGNFGGGGEVVDLALHYAFRSNEGSYKKSGLEQAMVDIFGVDSFDGVNDIMRQNEDEVPDEFIYHIPVATMKLATEGDEVAREIIENMGRELGRFAAAVVRRLGMENEAVPMVLIGSMFKTANPLLIDPYMEEVHKAAKDAFVVIPDEAPVVGALRLAIEAKKDNKVCS